MQIKDKNELSMDGIDFIESSPIGDEQVCLIFYLNFCIIFWLLTYYILNLTSF